MLRQKQELPTILEHELNPCARKLTLLSNEPAEIDHVPEGDTTFHDGMIIILREEVWDSAEGGEAAGPVKGNCEGTVSSSHLDGVITPRVMANEELNHLSSISLALKGRGNSKILQLQYASTLVGDHTNSNRETVLFHDK